MKRFLLILTLILAVFVSGCSYAPGNERAPFIEKWLELPSITMDDYQSLKLPTDSTEPSDVSGEDADLAAPIADPIVNLEDLPNRGEADFVLVKDYIPDIVVEQTFSTANNSTGSAVYDYSDAYLRYGTVLKLMEVQKELRQHGMLLKIWDSFRTLEAQQTLFEKSGGKGYSDPATGNNSQSRGNTVDVTLVNAKGEPVEMPSSHEDFSSFGDRDYSDCTEKAAANAQLLQTVMEKHGFKGLQSEWWQFTDTVPYDVEECVDPGEFALYYAVCNEFINIRSLPTYDAGAIGRITPDEQFTLLGWAENNFAYIDYQGQRGYVNIQYIAKVT